jgi:hypothetical protein
MDLETSSKFLHQFDEYIKRFDQLKKPPWYKNRILGIRAAIMHPDFSTDIATLMICEPESVLKLYIQLRSHLCTDYGYDPDVVESFLLYATGRNFDDLSPLRQVDGISVVDFEQREMQPAENPREVFDAYINKYDKVSPHIYIRLGRSVNKNDVEWFIDQYWDKYIDNKINTLPPLKYQRVPNTLFRDTMIYAMYKSGMKSSEIVVKIQKQFGGKQLEFSYIYKVEKALRPQYSYLSRANNQAKEYYGKQLLKPRLNFKNDTFYLTEN